MMPVLARVEIEGEQRHLREIDAGALEKEEREDPRLRRVFAADRERLAVELGERADARVAADQNLGGELTVDVAARSSSDNRAEAITSWRPLGVTGRKPPSWRRRRA